MKIPQFFHKVILVFIFLVLGCHSSSYKTIGGDANDKLYLSRLLSGSRLFQHENIENLRKIAFADLPIENQNKLFFLSKIDNTFINVWKYNGNLFPNITHLVGVFDVGSQKYIDLIALNSVTSGIRPVVDGWYVKQMEGIKVGSDIKDLFSLIGNGERVVDELNNVYYLYQGDQSYYFIFYVNESGGITEIFVSSI